ncbi:ribosome biogenesis GTPase YqeH [Alicyclobacillus hesperidum]|uniref:Ribosome biogenesis GTPase YqeH n=1 Tax=Alicyclobacillus hesperidum TaxID=89784 RepID=A0A1H2UBI2_9BACL|nr:ribosome biogenesis GTPase YqeH [Alicyclobacillus hesperidum]GLV14161.1 ribosome biogenesis GTPase YqeH [Alicyclobacillus hesperidum]SDW53486.1 hypothetical protein SAMN04489725_107132 [Alicyclobacillus hesperidum]
MVAEIVCLGCGAPLQSTDEDKPGYVPESAVGKPDVLCRRCFRIRHYGEFLPVTVDESTYQAQVAQIFERPGLVLYVVDVFDLAGSLVPNLARFVLNSEVVVVVNKVDLLPERVQYTRLADWIREQVERTRVPVSDVLFVSAEKQLGIEQVLGLVEWETERPVYVVGMANTGKSTLLNAIAGRLSDKKAPYTVSRRPGTTLALSRLEITGRHGRIELYDTPGLVHEARVIERLCVDCLRIVVPQSRLRPRVYQLNPEQTLFLGGIVRLDFERGDRQPIVLYVANDLPVHRTKLSRADEIWERHQDDILQVPCAACRPDFANRRSIRLQRVRRGEPSARGSLAISGRGSDIVIPGLGWIALSGRPFDGELSVPAWLGPSLRPRLVGDLSRRMEADAQRGEER